MRCKVMLPLGRCPQGVEFGTPRYCYYHNRILSGLIEPAIEEAYDYPDNREFNAMRELVKELTSSAPLFL